MKNSCFEFEIDLAANCIFINHHGLYDYDIILERGRACANDPLYQKNLNRMVDVTGCEEMLSSEDLRRISMMIETQSEERGNYREAFCLDTMVSHGVARMFDSLSQSSGVEYQIFHMETENVQIDLREWLHLPENYEFPRCMNIQ